MKPERILHILVLSMVSITAGSQINSPPPPPPPPVTGGITVRADSLLNEGNIKEAIAEYSALVKANPHNGKAAYDYACALSLGQQPDSAFRYLYFCIEEDPSSRVLTDPHLLNLRSNLQWKGFEDYTIDLISKKEPIRDIGYAKKLWELLCLDQYSFYETSLAARKLGPDSPVVSALRKLQEIKNENNLKELELLLAEKGWPEKSQVGEEASSAAFYILQHSNAEAQEKYITMFEKCCKKNEGNWQHYALMFDRMRMNKNQPQRYGTHTYMDPAAGRPNQLYPLEDEIRVDEWRREIGLEPLKDYMKKANIDYK